MEIAAIQYPNSPEAEVIRLRAELAQTVDRAEKAEAEVIRLNKDIAEEAERDLLDEGKSLARAEKAEARLKEFESICISRIFEVIKSAGKSRKLAVTFSDEALRFLAQDALKRAGEFEKKYLASHEAHMNTAHDLACCRETTRFEIDRLKFDVEDAKGFMSKMEAEISQLRKDAAILGPDSTGIATGANAAAR